MKAINQILGMTAERYNEFYFEKFMRWCMSYSTNFNYRDVDITIDDDVKFKLEMMETTNDLQNLLANRAISLWYRKEFDKLERKFLKDVAPFLSKQGVTLADIDDLYHETTRDIYSLYPKPLFEVARKTKILNDTRAN